MAVSIYAPSQTVSQTVIRAPVKYPETRKLRFSLNGKLVEIDNPDPRQLLVHWLRESGHSGTKVGTDAYEYSCVPYLALRNRERPILPQYVHTSALPNGLLNEVYTTSWLLTVQYQLPQNKEMSGELVSCPDPTFSRGKRVW